MKKFLITTVALAGVVMASGNVWAGASRNLPKAYPSFYDVGDVLGCQGQKCLYKNGMICNTYGGNCHDMDSAERKDVCDDLGYFCGSTNESFQEDLDKLTKAVDDANAAIGDVSQLKKNNYATGDNVVDAVSNLDGQVKKNTDAIGDVSQLKNNSYATGDNVVDAVGNLDKQVKNNTDNFGNYYDKDEVESYVANHSGSVDLTDYAKTADIANIYATKATIGSLTDFTGNAKGATSVVGAINAVDNAKVNKTELESSYYDKDEVESYVANHSGSVDLTEYAKTADIANIYATKATIGSLTDFTGNAKGATSVVGAINAVDSKVQENASNIASLNDNLEDRVDTVIDHYNFDATIKEYLEENPVSAQDTRIGDMTTLTTQEQNSVVGAINEVNGQVQSNTTAISDIKTDLAGNYTKTEDLIDYLEGQSFGGNDGRIGDMTTLTTQEQNSVVGAINEVNGQVQSNTTAISSLSQNLADNYYTKTQVNDYVSQQIAEVDVSEQINNYMNTDQFKTTINQQIADSSVVSNHTKAIAQNTADIASLNTKVGDGDLTGTHYAKDADNLTEGIEAVDTQVYQNTQDIDALNQRLDNFDVGGIGSMIANLNSQVNKLDDRMKAGFASSAALSALVPNARAIGNTQLSAGTGYYDGEYGAAAGLFHYINDNVLLNAGVSYAGDESLMARLGASFGF